MRKARPRSPRWWDHEGALAFHRRHNKLLVIDVAQRVKSDPKIHYGLVIRVPSSKAS
jgi:hypothetical protein